MSKYIRVSEDDREYLTTYQEHCEEVVAVYNSIQEASRQTGIKSPYICNCVKGKQKYAKGYYWCYVESEE